MTNLRDVISYCGGFVGNHSFLIYKLLKAYKSADLDNITDDNTEAVNNATEEVYMATAFLSVLNRGIYGVLIKNLHNTFWMGRSNYPKTLKAAYDLAINWKGDKKGSIEAPNDGVAFTTEEAGAHATNEMNIALSGKLVICHVFGKNHYANRCTYR